MSEDGSAPFNLWALDPMLGDETGSECGGAEERSAEPGLALWPSTSNPCGVQEYVPDDAINPSLLLGQSQELYNPATEAEVSTSARGYIHSLNETYNNSSPFSFSSFSDSSCYDLYDSNDDVHDGGSQPGPSTTRRDRLEAIPSLGANEERPSESLGMVKQFACDRCPRSFDKQHQLNRHIRWHEKPEICPRCVYRASYERDVTRHVWVKHKKWAEQTGYKSIEVECKICKAVLQRPDYLPRHMKEVHGGTKRRRGPKG
ncbi:hypothetical protein HDV63DRAFT_403106 [Trichoderma sp. SZMC 28014]